MVPAVAQSCLPAPGEAGTGDPKSHDWGPSKRRQTHRGRRPGGHGRRDGSAGTTSQGTPRMASCYQNREGGAGWFCPQSFRKEPAPAGILTSDFRPPEPGGNNCLSHRGWGTCYGSPGELTEGVVQSRAPSVLPQLFRLGEWRDCLGLRA